MELAPATGDPVTDKTSENEAPEPPESKVGPGNLLSDAELKQQALALLFASKEPLSLGALVKLLEGPERARVKALLAELTRELADSTVPIQLTCIAGGWRLASNPADHELLARLQKGPKPERITSASLETLAIIAYRQPVTKAEVDAIRGVQSGAMLRSLVDRGLARVTGRADQPGSPLQYGTTREFLERFGLSSLEDLPRDGELSGG